MKKIIARNLQTRDAYADKHELLAAKPRRSNQQGQLRRPEEPIRKEQRKVEQIRSSGRMAAGNPHSIGQFYCARAQPIRSRTRYQAIHGRAIHGHRSNNMRVQGTTQRRSRNGVLFAKAMPIREFRHAPPSPRRSAMNSRFPCILSDDARPLKDSNRRHGCTTASRRDVDFDLMTLSSLCADSVLDG